MLFFYLSLGIICIGVLTFLHRNQKALREHIEQEWFSLRFVVAQAICNKNLTLTMCCRLLPICRAADKAYRKIPGAWELSLEQRILEHIGTLRKQNQKP